MDLFYAMSCSSLKKLDTSQNIKVLNEKTLDSMQIQRNISSMDEKKRKCKSEINEDGEQEMEINLRSKIDSAHLDKYFKV